MKYFFFSAMLMGTMNINAQNINIDKTIELDGTEITASRIPIAADKATRLVQVLTSKEIEASSAQSVNDLLKLVAEVDVRQRGGYGIQTDIGVNGGNEDQLTVLLNGINISNPQTGHLTIDLPICINDIERIEIIDGGASRIYGSYAFAGAINIITKSEMTNKIGLNMVGGLYGTWSADGHINLLSGNFVNHISGGWTQSDGVTDNSDFKKGNLFWNEKFANDFMDVKLQAGMSTMKYGANTFYGTGSNSQYEEDSRYLISLQGESKNRFHIKPQLYWNRSYDHYVWFRNNPSAYENYHQTNVYGANINAWTQWVLGKTAIGFELRQENILSTRLGKPIDVNNINQYPGYKYKDGRSNIGIYIEHNIIFNNWSMSAGGLINKNTSVVGSMKFYPGIDISYSPINGMRVYTSFNQSLRTPTYTDLYYNGPGLEGNSKLKPEKSTNFSIGWSYKTKILNTQIKCFYRKGTDMIDWVKKEKEDIWTTANSDIDNIGADAILSFDFTNTKYNNPFVRYCSISYCYNYQHRINEDKTTTYAGQLTYLRHKLVAGLNHRIYNKLSAQWEFVFKERKGYFEDALTNSRQYYGCFGQLDLKVQWANQNYILYIQGNNITDKKYYDIANVQQPGFWFTAGAKINLNI